MLFGLTEPTTFFSFRMVTLIISAHCQPKKQAKLRHQNSEFIYFSSIYNYICLS